VLIVSAANPSTSRSRISHSTVSCVGPGVWAPSSFMFTNDAGSAIRFDQSVRKASHAPAGMRP
jgi:hypothetical protein